MDKFIENAEVALVMLMVIVGGAVLLYAFFSLLELGSFMGAFGLLCLSAFVITTIMSADGNYNN